MPLLPLPFRYLSSSERAGILVGHPIITFSPSLTLARMLAIMSGYIELNSRLECASFCITFMLEHSRRFIIRRFLHQTWIGSWIIYLFWEFLVQISVSDCEVSSSLVLILRCFTKFLTARIPLGSPLRNTHSLFWEYRSDDLGAPSSTDWLSLANSPSSGIEIISPAKVVGLVSHSVLLSDGSKVKADAVVLGTGFASSWDVLFDGMVCSTAYQS